MTAHYPPGKPQAKPLPGHITFAGIRAPESHLKYVLLKAVWDTHPAVAKDNLISGRDVAAVYLDLEARRVPVEILDRIVKQVKDRLCHQAAIYI